MCGIAGIWNFDRRPVDRAELDAFTDALAHRGPDGRGVWIDAAAGLGLGHRRLSILDLSAAGAQPMGYAGGRYQIVYNGEVFDFLELRQELAALGHAFASDTDTEVVAAAYAQWGEDCLERMNGMWGLAVWDAAERILFLARDRFGVKPLYFSVNGRRMAFASELKAFRHVSGLDTGLDPVALRLSGQNPVALERGERTWMAGVRRLQPGHCLTVRADGSLRERRWWNTLDHLPQAPRTYAGQVEAFRDLFADACRIRMRSDTAMGTALSGGLDSGSVLSMMAHVRQAGSDDRRLHQDWQRAFVGVYAGTPHDEETLARMVVDRIGGTGIYIDLQPPGPEEMDAIIFQMEEVYYEVPIGPWQVYRTMREQGVYVSLDGHGGDEVLGGYNHHVPFAMAAALRPLPRPVEYWRLREHLRRMPPVGRKAQLPRLADLWKGRVVRSGEGLSPDYAEDRPRLASLDPLTRALYVDTHYLTLPSIIRNFDRLSMGHGVEVRTPFLDWRLVCFAFALPGRSKVGAGLSKRILRSAMAGLLPDPVRLGRTKIGFGTPKQEWLSGGLRPWLLDTVCSRAFRESAVVDGPDLAGKIERACAARDWDFLTTVEQGLMAARLEDLMGRPTAAPPAARSAGEPELRNAREHA